MSDTLLQTLLAGFLFSSPLFSLGLIPGSALAATERPAHAWPYAVYGMLSVLLFVPLGWLLNAGLARLGLSSVDLPCYVLLLWGVNRALSRLFRPRPELPLQRPYFRANCAVLGAGLLAIGRFADSLPGAAVLAAGSAASFFVSVVVIAHFRERIETRGLSHRLAGWPSFLLLCALLWVAFEGLGSLLR